MGSSAERIVSEALELPSEVRAYVAERLIESLDAEPGEDLTPAWRQEVQRRCREIDQGLVQLCDAGDVFAKARSTLE
jgi:putative addiction module component (TIGR02574 family)